MKQRHTLVCALSVLALIGSAEADENASLVHSGIGAIPPSELLASDILALPDNERLAWIAGAVGATAQAVSESDVHEARCITDWYFRGGNGPEFLNSVLEMYSEREATAIIGAATRNACRTN